MPRTSARTGLPVWTTRAWERCAAVSAKEAATTLARRASIRVARPGTAFCSSSTTGMRWASAATTTGNGHIPPGADDDVGPHPAQQPARGDGGPRQLGRGAGNASGAAHIDSTDVEGLEVETGCDHEALGHPVRRPTTATSSSGRSLRRASATARAGVK